MMAEFIGILPAAGMGSRLLPFRYPKELLPIAYLLDESKTVVRPQLVIEHSVNALSMGGVRRAIVLVSDSKREVIRLLGDGEEHGVKLAYVPREVPRGLADAVKAGLDWVGDEHVALALPDTIFEPIDAFRMLTERLIQKKDHLVLGVFPTSSSKDLGPVDLNSEGRVLKVWEKPIEPTPMNTWGIAVWSPVFSRFLSVFLNECHVSDDLSIGHIFQAAVEKGLKVSAVEFVKGNYLDLGTPSGLSSFLRMTEEFPKCRDTFS